MLIYGKMEQHGVLETQTDEDGKLEQHIYIKTNAVKLINKKT